MLQYNQKNILNKDKLKIIFFGNINLCNGSDRIFCHTFSNHLNKQVLCSSKLIENFSENINFDIAIFKKDYPIYKLKDINFKKKNFLIGIINPSDKIDGIRSMKIADFAIVGSIEEKAYYSKYIKCFVYPLIEDIDKTIIKSYETRPKKLICYHGNKQHLDYININIENAILKLVKEGYKFKAVYDYKKLGKCKKRFITDHVQWEKETWLEEISNSTVGICPSTHYTGFIRNKIAKFIIRKRIIRNDYLLQFKNTSNASRAFIFHQLKIPVVAEIGGSFHHLLGDEQSGYICYSEKSWYESIARLCNDKNLNQEFSEKAFSLMQTHYDADVWCKRFINDINYWIINEYKKE